MMIKVQTWFNGLIILIGYFSSSLSYANSSNTALHSAIEQCRKNSSILVRLDCYDNIRLYQAVTEKEHSALSTITQKIIEQEKQRQEHTTSLLISQNNDDVKEVIITTPALGVRPPRPILAFSCIDNITRIQLVLFEKVEVNTSLTLKTNNGDSITTHWFLRDDAYVLESSRGLLGISEIQRLFKSDSVEFSSSNNQLNRLSFNIQGLEKVIQPLREACGW